MLRIDDPTFLWPLLTLDEAALEHNITTVAGAFAAAGVEHAPHVKTHMARRVWERQSAVGVWGATVATPGQLRSVAGWGVPRVFLANEIVDPRDIAWLRSALDGSGTLDEVWVYVDSDRGLDLLVTGFAGAAPEVVARLGVLVELGVPGGRTGLRTRADVVALAGRVHDAGLRLVGVAGYEGPVASGTSEEELAAVGRWCDELRETGLGVAGLVDGPLVLSAGGSAFADVVARHLGAPLRDAAGADVPTRAVLRSGAYVTHDHGHYLHADPWTRLGAEALRPAIRVWATVLSAPEPGLVIVALGRRDVSFDIDLPTPLVARTLDAAGRLGAYRELTGVRVTALNDQHAYLSLDAASDGVLQPGDVIGFGISHPCTTLDKYRTALVTRGDDVVEQVALDF
ncbi:alanine racemase [Promicromonospora thailandica]|uniref:D-serine deaminase, pyridoxal phosphate-dependent n=1 Tax=Promicromonospora thailandica TaxID=765201 RepID=A0A9X2JWB3_9MICO|nr:alanine racemase [Promicromonospora thailandica]MCP2262939.1 D-serine deaminase, pyridoxal phosphate-dependent [Promicromonospora thailandica]BFF18295.1 amino acid deaminase [Promicromonospora thailandica]